MGKLQKLPLVGSRIGITYIMFMFFASLVQAQIKTIGNLPSGYPRQYLVSFWSANGNGTDMISGHDGVLMNGAGFAPGKNGSAFDLDNSIGIANGWGSSQFPAPAFDGGMFVSVSNSTAWNFSADDFSISICAKFNAEPSYDIGHAQGGIFISHDEGPFEVNKWWFALGGGVLNVHLNDPEQGPVWLVSAPFAPKAHRWYNLVLTRKGNLFTIYVNGRAAGSETSARALPFANAPLNLGEAEGYYFNGQLDNVAIYDRALSDKEIKRMAMSALAY